MTPARSSSGVGDDRPESLHEPVGRVQRGAAEHARVQVALSRAEAQVVVDEPADAEVEGGHVLLGHAAVEDDAGIRAALVRREKVDDRVAARLLLAVEGDAHVHRQRAFGGQQRRRLEQEVRVALVVDGSAPVEVAVADLGLERLGFPEVERRGRLHVEVPVQEDGRRPLRSVRSRDLADHERRGLRLTISASPPAPWTKSRSHSPARWTSPAWAGSALMLGMRSHSESSSSQAGSSCCVHGGPV